MTNLPVASDESSQLGLLARLPTRWLWLGVLLAMPYVALGVVGCLWLRERGWMWIWFVVAGLVSALAWWLVSRWRSTRPQWLPDVAPVKPAENWAPAAHAAWEDVNQIAARQAGEEIAITDWSALSAIVQEVLDTVARRFHPRSKSPALEIPIPYVLKVVELVAADLRHAFSEHVPGSHILTLHDLQRMQRYATIGRRLYAVYRLASFGFDPISAGLREVGGAASGKLVDASTTELKHWAVDYAVRKAGYYAIQLYSGQLVLDDVAFQRYESNRSANDESTEERREATVAAEPLRILVAGQVKAGKSSLINAMFRETRAAVDVVPRTRFVEPYVLERDGIRHAIILDTAGYADEKSRADGFAHLRDEVLACDLILLVCSATSAARDADRRLLADFRECFHNEPTRRPPPILVVLSHIDELRPWNEWQPPYDLLAPSTAKGKNIAAAVEAVAEDLPAPLPNVIPVCLAPGREYNVEEALAPAILSQMNEAQRAHYLRCLKTFRDEEKWRRLGEQMLSAGRWLRERMK